MVKKQVDARAVHVRRPRYPGKSPRTFHQKYKELDPVRYAADVQKVLDSGKTPAGMHLPIMVAEVLACTRPRSGEIAVDCTLGGGGHARALLPHLLPGGRLIGLDVDPIELPRTEARLRAAGFGPDVFSATHCNFAAMPQALAAAGVVAADVIIADLGVSSMQLDNPDRGFSYKGLGPLDMRMNPMRGAPASELLARTDAVELAQWLTDNADEPHAEIIAGLLKQHDLVTTEAVEHVVREGLTRALPRASKADIQMSVRRTFQALRIAVNSEFATLDALLRGLPHCLAAGGRAAVLTFHSGEDRRVKKAFQAGLQAGLYATVADEVIRPSPDEVRGNRRAAPAKLRWAVRSDA
ncbi:MAG: 16S rRNA (cytosine(1402)-N(4))-methyltransferase RsmH [Vicinamibacterales bacterium]